MPNRQRNIPTNGWLRLSIKHSISKSEIVNPTKPITAVLSQYTFITILFGVVFVFYTPSSTSFQSIKPLPFSSSSTARAMTLRLSALNGSV